MTEKLFHKEYFIGNRHYILMEVPSPQIFKDNSTIKIQHSKIRLAKAIINAFRVFVKTMMEKEIEEPIPEPVDHKKIAIDIKSQM